jgi:multidrug efflux pump subunit AcrA (membrane-fusion protein)
LFGRVTADETRVYKLNVGLDGYVREMSGATTGSQVRKDEWLLTYSAPEVRQPIQGYLAMLESIDRETRNNTVDSVQAAFAKAGIEQSVDRLLTMGMSPVQVDEIERTRVVPPTIKMTAPVGGFVLARNVSVGQKVEKDFEVFRIADLGHLWILADVPAGDADRVRPGLTAEISLAGRTLPIRARVSRDVLPQFDPATQSSKVRLEAENPGFMLRPDMFVDVDVRVDHSVALVVPAGAVVAAGLSNTVFVERQPGFFEARHVEIGRRAGDRVEIRFGLHAGERVAVSGTFLLDSESRMRAARRGGDGHD